MRGKGRNPGFKKRKKRSVNGFTMNPDPSWRSQYPLLFAKVLAK
jgi:hypothetical protein